MPQHMQQIAGAGQALLQIPSTTTTTAAAAGGGGGGGGYPGRAVPSVSLLNDLPPSTTAPAGTGTKLSPRDPLLPPPPAAAAAGSSGGTSSGPASVPRAAAGEGSTTSTGGGGGHHRRRGGTTPPIRPIEISRFPFLSPAIGTDTMGTTRGGGGLTPASLPNILNTTAAAAGEASVSTGDSRSGGGGGAGGGDQSVGKPQKFASLHRMVADVRDDESDDGSSGGEGAGVRSGTAEQERGRVKRKRRKVDHGRGGSEDVDQEVTALGRDPVSCGFVTEGQARELFDM